MSIRIVNQDPIVESHHETKTVAFSGGRIELKQAF